MDWTRRITAATLLLGLAGLGASCAAENGAEGIGRSAAPLEESEGGECLVGEETVEHACQHALFGPFASVSGQSYPGFVFSDIDTPHTSYSITLPGAGGTHEGAVLYHPAASGKFAFFTTPETTVTVYDSAGQPVAPDGSEPVDPSLCSAMASVTVLGLEETESYTLVLGPTNTESPQVIVEYLGEGGCEACEHVHLVAAKNYGPPPSWENAVASLDHPIAFEIPEEIPVTEGNSGNHWVRFSFRSGSGPKTRCVYRGGANVAHPVTPPQLALATRYVFFGCNDGLQAGDDVEADWFKLRVLHGGNACFGGRTEVELEIEDEACHGHDHEDE